MTANTRNIVILGGSYAGLSVAHYFLKHILPSLPKTFKDYHVYLIDPSTHFYHRVAAPRASVSFDLMPITKTFYDISNNFKGYKPEDFTFLRGKATGLDTTRRTVTIQHTGLDKCKETELPYHALILATGTKAHLPILSLQGGGHEEVLEALSDLHDKLACAKSIIVGGGGPSGVELAGEIGEFVNGTTRWFKQKPTRPKTQVILLCGSKKLLPVLRPALAKQAEAYLARVGVSVKYSSRIESTEKLGDGHTKLNLGNGETLVSDLYLPATGVTPMTEYIPYELLDDRGYVKTNQETLRVDEAGLRVYAIGDVGNHSRGGILDIYEAIPVLMTNLQRDLLAAHEDVNTKPTGDDRKYKKNASETQLVPIGRSKGVGAFNGNRLPTLMVHMIKGRDYLSSAAVEIVTGTKWNKQSGWKPTDGCLSGSEGEKEMLIAGTYRANR
ncbi:unnamed protein product [Aureobasidium uvarum]|uniref:FAD/NAD(P)-binding domain-containing protein n=1 Tax=Aureobasidium uvarum TaxID=2773716 RepID=A0A9N8KM65_9PEZI|nr:unnamed protein product [Aureobasidium uvarum]